LVALLAVNLFTDTTSVFTGVDKLQYLQFMQRKYFSILFSNDYFRWVDDFFSAIIEVLPVVMLFCSTME
jgi:hypothetical protein